MDIGCRRRSLGESECWEALGVHSLGDAHIWITIRFKGAFPRDQAMGRRCGGLEVVLVVIGGRFGCFGVRLWSNGDQ